MNIPLTINETTGNIDLHEVTLAASNLTSGSLTIPSRCLSFTDNNLTIPKGHQRNITVTLAIPNDTAGGEYSGCILVTSRNGGTGIVNVDIEVIGSDIAVTDVTPSTNVTYVGRMVTIDVTTANLGTIPQTFNLSVYYDAMLIGVTGVQNLPPEANITITFIWNTTGVPPCNYYNITAKAESVPGETNIANNMLQDGKVKIKMMGDIDGDGYVGIDDLVLAASSFGAYPGHLRWDSNVDLNQDGYIGIDDVALIAKNFGSCV